MQQLKDLLDILAPFYPKTRHFSTPLLRLLLTLGVISLISICLSPKGLEHLNINGYKNSMLQCVAKFTILSAKPKKSSPF